MVSSISTAGNVVFFVRRDPGHHTLKGEQALARVRWCIAGGVLAHNDGKGCAEVVQQTPFSPQLLRISQFCQAPFILDLEIDLGGRHIRMCSVFCRGVCTVSRRFLKEAAF